MIVEFPNSQSKSYFNDLLKLGEYIENTSRSGNENDFIKWPNKIWKLYEKNMHLGFLSFIETQAPNDGFLVLQWYNSGIFVKFGNKIVGFDILPVPRYYGWPDEKELTELIASNIVSLFITHDHRDHCDPLLIKACYDRHIPVYMHEKQASDFTGVFPMGDDCTIDFGNFTVTSQKACHVWRNNISDVNLCYFTVSSANDFNFVFFGDADYTKVSRELSKAADLVFITWRNPNSKYEDRNPDQIGNTFDAIKLMTNIFKPKRIVLEHYGEFDHIYKGFGAGFDHAINLINNLEIATSIYMPGEQFALI